VLTPFRISNQDERPLRISEFIGRLSQCAVTMDDSYGSFKDFTDNMTGDLARRKLALAAAKEEDGEEKK
jgi:hypothetical protein